MNERHKRFAEFYASCANATEAAKRRVTAKKQQAVKVSDC